MPPSNACRYKEYERGSAPPVLERLAALYRKVDAFAIVSGEYNHGMPPGLKNLLDHFLVPSLLPIPRAQDAFTPEGEPADPALERRCERFFAEFEWYARALRAAGAAG